MSRVAMSRLKLAAADAEDIEILSARLQDAVLKLKAQTSRTNSPAENAINPLPTAETVSSL